MALILETEHQKDHIRNFHSCRGAVEHEYRRSPSRLSYHVSDLVATSAIYLNRKDVPLMYSVSAD